MTRQKSEPEIEQIEMGIALAVMPVASSIVAGFFTTIWIPIGITSSVLLVIGILVIANVKRKVEKPLIKSFVQLSKASDRVAKYWPF